MTWLLRLYPRAWRQRYGGEMAALLESRRLSVPLVMDLLAGAIDARLHRDYPLAAASPQEGAAVRTLFASGASKLSFRVGACESAGPIAVLIVYAVGWVSLSGAFGETPAIEAFPLAAFPAIFFVGWSIRTLRLHSHRAKAILMTFVLAVFWVIAFGLVVLLDRFWQ